MASHWCQYLEQQRPYISRNELCYPVQIIKIIWRILLCKKNKRGLTTTFTWETDLHVIIKQDCTTLWLYHYIYLKKWKSYIISFSFVYSNFNPIHPRISTGNFGWNWPIELSISPEKKCCYSPIGACRCQVYLKLAINLHILTHEFITKFYSILSFTW